MEQPIEMRLAAWGFRPMDQLPEALAPAREAAEDALTAQYELVGWTDEAGDAEDTVTFAAIVAVEAIKLDEAWVASREDALLQG